MTCQMTCRKRAFATRGAARRAHEAARFRIIAYVCRDCHRWHVANGDKREVRGPERMRRDRRRLRALEVDE